MKEMIELQEKKILELLQREKMLNDYMARLQSINNQLFAVKVDLFAAAVDAFANKIEDFVQSTLKPQILPVIVPPPAVNFTMPEWMMDESKAPLTKNDLTFDPNGAVKVWEVHPAIEGENDPDIRGDFPPATEEENAASRRRSMEEQERARRWMDENRGTGRTAADHQMSNPPERSWVDDALDIGSAPYRAYERWMLGMMGYDTSVPGRYQRYQKGGIVYAANGGAMDMSNIGFKPKGTDTIPAMLSPGEFVVRKKAVDKLGVDTLNQINNGTLYANDGALVPEMDYRAELEQRIKNEEREMRERKGNLGILGGAFDWFRRVTTGDGGSVGDATSRSKISAYRAALESGDAENIKRLAKGQGASGGSASGFGRQASYQEELLNTQNELAKDLYMTVPTALAGTVMAGAPGAISPYLATPLTTGGQFGLGLAGTANLALPWAAAKQTVNSTLSGSEFDMTSVGQDVLGDIAGAGVLDAVPGSDIITSATRRMAFPLQRSMADPILDASTTAIGNIIESGGKAVNSVAISKAEDAIGNSFSKGGYVKPTYLAQGGPPEGYMGRSQQNLRRFGWSDPRFEQGGLRGLDPSSPYYQDALAYWQYIMAWQNQYNQRAANWNNGIRAQQMQAMQMMLTNWGYYAKGGYVKPTYLRNGGITASPLNNDVLTPQVLTDMRNGNLIPTDTVRSGESTMRKVLGNTVTDAAFGAITEDLQDSADIFDWPGMLGVNRYANESRLDENGVELPYHMQPREVRMSRFDDPSRRNVFEQGLFDMGEKGYEFIKGYEGVLPADDTIIGLPFALGHQAIEAFRGYDTDQKLERLKADRARKEEFAAFEEEELEKTILRNLKSIDQQDNAKKELKMKKLLYDEKYGGDISLEDVQSFEAGKVKTAQWEKDDKAPGGYRRTGEYDIKPGLQEQRYAEMMRQQQQAASAADEIPTVETPQPTPTPPQPTPTPPQPTPTPSRPAQAPQKPQKPASGVPLKPLSQYKSDRARDSAIRAAKAAGRPLTSEESMYNSRREVQRNNADPQRASRTRRKQSPFTNIMDGAIRLGMGMLGGGKPRVDSSAQNRGSVVGRPSSRPSGFGVHSVSPTGQRVFTPTGSDGLPYYTTAVEGNRPTGISLGGMSAMLPSNFQNPQQPIAQGMLTGLGLGPDVEAGQNPNGITLDGANTLANQAGLRTDIASFTNTGAAGRIQEQVNSQLSDIMKRRPGFIGNNTAYSITPNNQQQGMAPQLPSRSSSLLMASQQFGQQQNSPMSGGPTTMQLQGSQEITIRLPDIQAMVNQNITGMIYSTIATYFNQLAGYVRNASNFEDLANEMSNGMQTTQTQQVGGGQ
jgi:hypothetical protein